METITRGSGSRVGFVLGISMHLSMMMTRKKSDHFDGDIHCESDVFEVRE